MTRGEPSFTPVQGAVAQASSAIITDTTSKLPEATGEQAALKPTRATRHPGARRRKMTVKSQADLRAIIARMRSEASERARADLKEGSAPIRVMARMVAELESSCRDQNIPEELIASEIVNRTIGDVDLRKVSPTEDGPEFVSLADDMGLALPGEIIGGRPSTGEVYRWIRERMLDFERQLLERRFDLRMYDISGTGNPLLREMISSYAHAQWGCPLPPQQIHLSLGALDGLDKFFRGFAFTRRSAGHKQTAVVFPAPSFNVPEWQAQSLGLRLHRLYTMPEDHFKVTPQLLRAALDEEEDIAAFYLTVSNNPTAFAYSPSELESLFSVVAQAGREVTIVADLAYIGTGIPEDDRARMAMFLSPEVLRRCVFVSSFSKTHTLTGDRCGWVGFGEPSLAKAVGVGWTNTTASLPADWQLRYMANVALFQERPELGKRIRSLYTHRRERLVRQLNQIDQRFGLFARVNLDDGGTVYNWSQLRPGVDAFTLFGRTGIAGVPGSGFGYSDDFMRLSVGCIPVPVAEAG
ncbi:MAG: pyridoxal phosphate-dependent aminotransferase [Ktedonobacterales bacterium]